MHRSIRWAALALLVLAVGIVWLRPRSAVRIRLNPDRELRVLAVSLGTNHVYSVEPLWKRAARRALPVRWQKPLGAWRAQGLQTKHETLVVWFDEVHAPGTLPVELLSERVEAVMPDGSLARGTNRRSWAGAIAVEFPWFDRAAERVPLRIQDGTNFVTFLVDNPRPSHALRWTARTPPQTCEVARTEIALLGVLPGRRFGRFEEPADAVVHARALGPGRLGWMARHLTAFDPLGNWSECDWTHGEGFLRVPPLPASAPVWKLSFEALEYLSAGRVPLLTNGEFLVLPPDVRARGLGAQFVMFAGPGAYRVTNGLVVSVKKNLSNGSARPSVRFSSVTVQTNWSVELRTVAAGILCVSDVDAAGRSIRARLRERVGDNGGRVFGSSSVISAVALVNGTNRLATFHVPRLPALTTNLEVELIATLPPAEFLVRPPGR